MTLCEVWLEFEAAEERERDEFQRRTVQAYQIVLMYAMYRPKRKMPKLGKFLASARTPGAQTKDEMLAAVEVITQQFGSRIKRKQ